MHGLAQILSGRRARRAAQDHRFQGRRLVTPIGSLVSVVLGLPRRRGSRRAAAAQLASKDDAVVSTTDTGWAVGNALLTYGVGFDTNGDLVVQDLRRTGDARSWRPMADPRHPVPHRGARDRADPQRRRPASATSTPTSVDTGTGLELRLVFENLRDGLRARRIYADLPAGRHHRDLDRARVDAQRAGRGRATWSRCSWSSTAPWSPRSTVSTGPPRPAARSRCSTMSSSDDAPVMLEERGRSTQRYLPLVDRRLGARHARRRPDVVGLLADGFRRASRAAGPSSPPGCRRPRRRSRRRGPWRCRTPSSASSRATRAQVAPALHRFIVSALRGGRLLEPLVTYNTWFSTGTDIDEESIEKEMDAAAAAGARSCSSSTPAGTRAPASSTPSTSPRASAPGASTRRSSRTACARWPIARTGWA